MNCYPISSNSRDCCFWKKRQGTFKIHAAYVLVCGWGVFLTPHAGQCLNPWGMWFDFLYHLPYRELRVNIVELKWRLMFRYWCVSIKGRHEVKAEWVYTSYWERLYILNHLEEHFTEKTWNSNLIQSRAIISSIRAQERSLYSTTNILLYYTGLKQVYFGSLNIARRRQFF